MPHLLIVILFGGGDFVFTVWDLVQAIRAHARSPLGLIAFDLLAILVIAISRLRGQRHGE